MVKCVKVLVCCLLFLSCNNDNNQDNVIYQPFDSLNLIPKPLHLESKEGYFTIDEETTISIVNHQNLSAEANYLKSLIDASSTFEIPILNEHEQPTNSIRLKIEDGWPIELLNGESYRLNINNDELVISAITSTGIMRGIQTLRQIFIPEFHSDKRSKWYLPSLFIEDKPKFEHRGLLLDVCRHFFDVETVKKYIDLLAFYKMNVLHFHLTEDQGWRIEIDKYPLLNEIGSYRTEPDGERYGGYFTKEELKELVAYAKTRHITIIPEIELPGHSQAAIASYPHLSCTGEKVDVVNDWGVFKEIYCAGNDSVFTFLKDVLTEVMEIFPSEFIHIGGDEAPKSRWESCPKCQRRIETEGLKDERELQSWFIGEIEKFLNENGRVLIGWDEILEGGLSPNATVQSWRGMEGGLEAANQDHFVIMSPTSHCYLDYDLKSIDLRKVYSFDPIPIELEQEKEKYILGAEVNMWTEHVLDVNTLDAKIFPRLIAMSEVLWSYPQERDFIDFYQRLQGHYPILKKFNINYGLEAIGGSIKSIENEGKPVVMIHKNLPGITLKYRWKCQECDSIFIPVDSVINIDRSAMLEIQFYKDEQKYGPSIKQEMALHKALFQKVNYDSEYNQWYTGGGESALVDGKIGSIDFRDGNWQGFWGKDLYLSLELEQIQEIQGISMNFYQYANAWIFAPKEIQVDYSLDGKEWKEFNNHKNLKVDLSNEKSIYSVKLENIHPVNAKWIRLQVKNLGKVPAPHEAEGEDAWIFIDELNIY